MFLTRLVVVVAGIAAITVVTGSERARAAIGRHPLLLWLYLIGAAATLEVVLRRGGLHLVTRSLGAGLLFVVLVPASQFLFGLVLNVWDWVVGRAEQRALVRSGQDMP